MTASLEMEPLSSTNDAPARVLHVVAKSEDQSVTTNLRSRKLPDVKDKG